MRKLSVISFILLFFYNVSLAQTTDGVEMADALRSSGKIYVVVAVISVIFIGIITYLFSMDKRIKKIEKKNNVKTTIKDS